MEEDLIAGVGFGFQPQPDASNYLNQVNSQHLLDCPSKHIQKLDQCPHCFRPTTAPIHHASSRVPSTVSRGQFRQFRRVPSASYAQVARTPPPSHRSPNFFQGAPRSSYTTRYTTTRPITYVRERNDFPVSAGPAGYQQIWRQTAQSSGHGSPTQSMPGAASDLPSGSALDGLYQSANISQTMAPLYNSGINTNPGFSDAGLGQYPYYESYTPWPAPVQQPGYVNPLPRVQEEAHSQPFGATQSNFNPQELYDVIDVSVGRERHPIPALGNDEGYVTLPPSTATQSLLSTSTRRSADRRTGHALHDPNLKHHCRWINCGCTFSDPAALQRHYRNVHEERRISCTFADCTKKFLHPKDLERHLLTHQDNRQVFYCPHYPCPKKYGRRDNLRRHITKEHGAMSIVDSGLPTSPSMSRQLSQSSAYSQNQPRMPH